MTDTNHYGEEMDMFQVEKAEWNFDTVGQEAAYGRSNDF